MPPRTAFIDKYLAALNKQDLLITMSWDDWLSIEPAYDIVAFTSNDATVRYNRNGYDWDMHGTLYTPEKEVNAKRAFVCFHGGAGSEKIIDLTPDGRPGLARALAAQG